MNTLESIAAGIAGALEPLTVAFSSPRRAEQLLNALGWQLPPGVTDIGLSKVDVAGLVDKVTDLHAAAKFEGSDSGVSIGISADLLVTVQAFLRDLNDFAKSLNALFSADYLTRTRIREEFPRRLLDYLFIQELRLAAGPVLTVFSLTGIVRFEPRAEDPLNFGSAHVRHIVAYDRIGPLLTDTGGQLRQFFDWGTPQFDSGKVLLFFGFFLQAIGGRVKLRPLAREVEERLSGHNVPEADTAPLSHLVASFKAGSILDDSDIGLIVLGLRPSAPGGSDGGFAFSAFLRGTADRSLNMRENLTLELDSTLDLAEGTVASFRPGHPLQFQTGVSGKHPIANATQGRMAFRTRYPGPAANPITLFAIPGGTSLKAKEVTFAFGVDTKGAGPSPFIEFGLNRLHFHLTGLGSDGFLASVLPLNLDADFDLLAGWSGEGVYFQGSSALQVQLASHISIGSIEILALTLEVGFDGGKVAVKIASSIKGSLGPLTALVEGVGVEAGIRLLGDNSGNLGPIDLVPRLTPPNGVGLSLDAGILKGGGFLSIDVDKGEYVGAMELDFIGIISLKAIAIINTKMPDGSKGFSLLIIITADFPPIQLGFGFTLNAVGGLLGLNRTVNIDALRAGVRTNAIKSVLFPQDVIANITRIVSDLKQIFPPLDERFIVGPMAELGWGTPSIITIELGILIEIPVPRIAILGVLAAFLPAEELALLRIQVNFLGVIDFDNKYISFDATLFDSRLLIYTLTGDMAFRLSWGDNPMFILSVGGFHPGYHDAPQDLQHMTRLGISLLSGDNPRISVLSYFAVTSNTVQFGARAELYAEAAGFNVYGFIGYDVLFQFDPFKFIASFEAGLALREGTDTIMGIHLAGQLSGINPWNARGEASITILFFEISVSFNETWGDDATKVEPPKEDILARLTTEINDNRNWRAEIPDSNNLHVSIRKMELPPDQLVIHPMGVLTFSERLVPLGVDITKFGNKVPLNAKRFDIKATDPGILTQNVTEEFAPANFFDKNDNEKLASPSFDRLTSGFKVTGASSLVMPTAVNKSVDYELTYLHKKRTQRTRAVEYKLAKHVFKASTKASAAAVSTLSYARNRISVNAPDAVALEPRQYGVANVSDMRLAGPDLLASSYTEASQKYNALIARRPELKDQVQILAHHELNRD